MSVEEIVGKAVIVFIGGFIKGLIKGSLIALVCIGVVRFIE